MSLRLERTYHTYLKSPVIPTSIGFREIPVAQEIEAGTFFSPDKTKVVHVSKDGNQLDVSLFASSHLSSGLVPLMQVKNYEDSGQSHEQVILQAFIDQDKSITQTFIYDSINGGKLQPLESYQQPNVPLLKYVTKEDFYDAYQGEMSRHGVLSADQLPESIDVNDISTTFISRIISNNFEPVLLSKHHETELETQEAPVLRAVGAK